MTRSGSCSTCNQVDRPGREPCALRGRKQSRIRPVQPQRASGYRGEDSESQNGLDDHRRGSGECHRGVNGASGGRPRPSAHRLVSRDRLVRCPCPACSGGHGRGVGQARSCREVESCLHSCDLGQDVDAVALVLDHSGHAADLTFHTRQPLDELLLGGRVATAWLGRWTLCFRHSFLKYTPAGYSRRHGCGVRQSDPGIEAVVPDGL